MTTSPRSFAALVAEYGAVRSATLGSGPPRSQLDHSALGLAYHNLKLRNHLAVLINRALRRPLIPTFPIEVQFNNIGFCNLRCPHCPTHGTDEQHAIYQQKSFTMPRADIEKISQETMPYAQKVVTSGLGEGLLHKDVAAIVASASRYGVAFFTNTNGTTLLPKIVGGLFGISEMRLSLDGATPAAFEAMRLGAKYDKVMRNVTVVSRANERLPPTLRLRPTVNFGITASSVRDMPIMVDLCAHLGLEAVFGFRMVPLNPKYAEDDIEKFPAAYKYYYLQAMQRARARNMVVTLPAPDPNVEPDPMARPSDTGMIVTGLDDAYYQRLPDFGRLIDTTDLEPEVDAMAVAALEAGIARHAAAQPAAVRDAAARTQQLDTVLDAEIQRGFQTMSNEERDRLRSMHKSERMVADCIFLQAHLIYNASGTVSPCCDSTIEIAHNSEDPRAILRSAPLQTLVGEFVTGRFRKNCAGCAMRQTIPERQLFPVAIK